MLNYLLVTGESGSGKDTTVIEIKERLLNVYHVQSLSLFAFGDALKQVTSRIYDIPLDTFYGPNKEQHRHLLHKVADVIKWVDPLFFTKMTLSSLTPSQLNICTDWRYDYEYKALIDSDKSGQIKIKTVRLLRNFNTKGNHNSERTLDKFQVDFQIDNTNMSPQQVSWQILKRMEIWFPELFN